MLVIHTAWMSEHFFRSAAVDICSDTALQCLAWYALYAFDIGANGLSITCAPSKRQRRQSAGALATGASTPTAVCMAISWRSSRWSFKSSQTNVRP